MAKALKTVDIPGVEIARAGKWRGTGPGGKPSEMMLTIEDFDAAIAAEAKVNKELGPGKADFRIKIGHDALQMIFGDLANELADGAPAFGWGHKLRRRDDVLIADLKKVPEALDEYLKVGAWRDRSIEFGRQWMAGGERHEFYVVALSLLGASPPAVEGLADIYELGQDGTDGASFLVCCAKPAALTEADLERRLTELIEELDPYFHGRAGAPMARLMFKAWRGQLVQAMRFDPTPKEPVKMKLAITTLVGAKPDATNADIVQRLASADDVSKAAIMKLALNEASAMAVLAELLGVPGATPDEVVNAVRELKGIEVTDPTTGEPVSEDGDISMAAKTTEIEALKAQLAKSDAALTAQATKLALHMADARVERSIADNSLEEGVRPILTRFALAGDDTLYQATVATSRKVNTKERGTSGLSKAEDVVLSADEIAIARSMGTSLDDLRAYKLAQSQGA